MDAFESLIALLLRHQGYWVTQNFKVDLTKKQKRLIDRPTSPRREIDVVAYKASTNEVLAVECKSFLDSQGVVFRNGKLLRERGYKLFNDAALRKMVFKCLKRQLMKGGSCSRKPSVTLCLAAGKIAKATDDKNMRTHFGARGWRLFDPEWIEHRLRQASERGYENDVATIVSKLLLRKETGRKGDIP